jgi:hypothetical protein
MPRKCAHYDLHLCPDPDSRWCHYVQNSISTAVSVKSILDGFRRTELTMAYPTTSRFLEEIESFLREVGYDAED